MSLWFIFQFIFNLVLSLGLVVLWMRFRRPPKDDPRLSRGLQLLQSKISVLEDLSDRTDKQVKQLSSFLDQKARQLQNKIFEADKQVSKVEQSMHKSMEVAEIFQDKIPHEEILERQNTIKYVQAARLAHAGHSLDEIESKVDLPREQIAFIAKVNKEQLMFDDSQLPAWVESDSSNLDLSPAFEPSPNEFSSLKKLGDEFRSACETYDKNLAESENYKSIQHSQLFDAAKKVTNRFVQSASDFLNDKFQPEPEELSISTVTPTAPLTIEKEEELIIEGLSRLEKNTSVAALASAAPVTVASSMPKTMAATTPQPANPVLATPKKPDPTVRPVRFPRIDINDNLG